MEKEAARRTKRLQRARGVRTKARAAEEWSGSPSAAPGPSSAAVATSWSAAGSANLLAASPVLVGVAGARA